MGGRAVRGVAFAALVVAVAAAYRWWTSDERAIRAQMSEIAESLTRPLGEGELASVARIARLRNVLAPDVRVSASAPRDDGTAIAPDTVREVAGRDTILALVARWVPPPGGVTVEFVDVQVTVDAAAAVRTASVYCTATLTSRDASGRPSVDAREMVVGFSHIDGTWLLTSARPEETLRR